MSILRNKKETTAEDFAPWAGGEDGLAYLGEVLMSEGMSRRAMYNLEILTIIINE